MKGWDYGRAKNNLFLRFITHQPPGCDISEELKIVTSFFSTRQGRFLGFWIFLDFHSNVMESCYEVYFVFLSYHLYFRLTACTFIQVYY